MASASCHSAVDNIEKRSPRQEFVRSQGVISDNLATLLKITGLYDEKDSLEDIVNKTQQHWISGIQGSGGKERTDFIDSAEQKKIAKPVIEWAKKMKLFDERKPLLRRYDYGVVLGTNLKAVRERIAQFVRAWEEGIRFDKLVFLSGERDLRKGEGEPESIAVLCDPSKSPLAFKKGWSLNKDTPYETEYDMVLILWDQLEIPQDMADALKGKIEFINAPRGSYPRPSTKDTFEVWMNTHPKPGTILAYGYPLLWVQYQIVGENVLQKKGFALDTAAYALSEEDQKQYGHAFCALILDTVAKVLFEIKQAQFEMNVLE
jgi:hypothetical protein